MFFLNVVSGMLQWRKYYSWQFSINGLSCCSNCTVVEFLFCCGVMWLEGRLVWLG
jgi:hypothetical protein